MRAQGCQFKHVYYSPSRSYIWPWGFRGSFFSPGSSGWRRLWAASVPEDKCCVAPDWNADHVGLPFAGWLLRSGLVLTHLTRLFLPQFIWLFASCSLHLPTYIYFGVFIINTYMFSSNQLCKNEREKERRLLVTEQLKLVVLDRSRRGYKLIIY